MPKNSRDCMACIISELGYFNATIWFNEKEIDTEEELEGAIGHELLHIILEPLSAIATAGIAPKFESYVSDITESTIETVMHGFMKMQKLLK